MSASSLVCKRVLPKDARKLLRAVFPVLKEKDEDLKDITEKLKLVFNHDLNIRLNTYGINVYPIGHLETFARGGYNVGTRDSISRWLRLSNRKFVVMGCFGTDTCSYNSLGRVVETAPYDHISEEKLLQVFPQFLGEIKQAVSLPEAPPRDAEMVAKRDHVAVMKHLAICHSIRCTELSLPHFSLDILCGPGFSPRVFVHDLGKALDSCAHVTHMELKPKQPLRSCTPFGYTHVGDMRNEMKDRASHFGNVARYF
ncbi:hypothetical protein MRX96_006678 [Rhipicephalus microplus]